MRVIEFDGDPMLQLEKFEEIIKNDFFVIILCDIHFIWKTSL